MMTWTRLAAGLLAVLALGPLLLGGCVGLFRSVEQPEVYVIHVEPTEGESGLLEQRLKVDLRIRNPNDYDLDISGVDFHLDVNGNHLARGLGNESVTVPRLGEATLSVIATTTLMDVVRQVSKLGQQQTEGVAYVLKGKLYVGRGWGSRVPFENSGTLIDQAKPQ